MTPSLVLLLAALPLESKLALAEENVYGQQMTNCGGDHPSGCTYAAYDAGAHEVCVTQLPHGFSSDTGQGPWSDQFTGQPWCICIWAYSNYILQHKDLSLQCKSIPSKVLEEQYSLDKFQQCGSMSSTEGCGPEDIRRSIESLCQQCDQQAEDDASKTALKAKCKAILASAPAAPLQRLYAADSPKIASESFQPSSLAFAGFGAMVAGVSVTMLVRTFRNEQVGDDLMITRRDPFEEDLVEAGHE